MNAVLFHFLLSSLAIVMILILTTDHLVDAKKKRYINRACSLKYGLTKSKCEAKAKSCGWAFVGSELLFLFFDDLDFEGERLTAV